MGKIRKNEAGISFNGIRRNNLRFADDVDLTDEEQEHKLCQTRIVKTKGMTEYLNTIWKK
jgi:hypothetical protein